MATLKGVKSRDSVASNKSGRPGIMSRASQNVRARGGKGVKGQPIRQNTRDDASSTGTAVVNPTLKSFTGVFRAPEQGCRPTPPAKLEADQEAKLSEMLSYFRALEDYPCSLKPGETKREPANDWEKLRMLSRESMLRYLRATKWDVPSAKKRLTESIAWRREFGVDDLNPAELEREAKSGKETVMGFDNHARPLHYMNPHRNNTKESPTQMQFAVWILERCIDLMPPGVEQLALLINFEKKSSNPTSISNAKLMLYILQNHYVERLGVALCINVPWVFKAFWSAIQPLIDPVTKSKCKFDEGIKEEVPAAQLSQEYGGEVDPQYQHDSYWPDLIKVCDARREAMKKRFKEQCHGEIGASEWVIRGGNDDSLDKVPLHTEDVAAITKAAPDKSALARTESDRPAEAPTTQVSDPEGAEKGDPGLNAREQAVERSEARARAASSGMILPNGHRDDTDPLARIESNQPDSYDSFKTPMTTLDSNPLDRQISKMNLANGVPSRTSTPAIPEEGPIEAAAAGGTAAAAVVAADAPLEPHDSQRLASEGESTGTTKRRSFMATTFNKLVHPHHDSSHSRRGSQDSRRSAAATTTATTEGSKRNSSAPPTSKLTILFFAAARDAAGTSTLTIPLRSTPLKLSEVPALIRQSSGIDINNNQAATAATTSSGNDLKDMNRLMQVIERSQWSVDEVMVSSEDVGNRMLSGGEEIAVIPPVSGG